MFMTERKKHLLILKLYTYRCNLHHNTITHGVQLGKFTGNLDDTTRRHGSRLNAAHKLELSLPVETLHGTDTLDGLLLSDGHRLLRGLGLHRAWSLHVKLTQLRDVSILGHHTLHEIGGSLLRGHFLGSCW